MSFTLFNCASYCCANLPISERIGTNVRNMITYRLRLGLPVLLFDAK